MINPTGLFRTALILLAALLTIGSWLVVGSCSSGDIRVSRSENHMGTVVSISMMSSNHRKAEQAIEEAFAEFRRLDLLLSHYIETSELQFLNTEGHIEEPSADLLTNVLKSLENAKLSKGAFDITVLPILDLYSASFKNENRPPSDAEIRETLKDVDYRRILIHDSAIALRKGQRITLGGIAKGYAVDAAVHILQSHGIKGGLVDAGGDLRAWGKKEEGRSWVVALRNPRKTADFISRIGVTDRSVVTSGDYERYYDDERKYHHIVDPRTGYSATQLISVTIVAERAFDADAIATAVFVMGESEGLKLIERLPDVEGLIITREREILKSSGFDAYELEE